MEELGVAAEVQHIYFLTYLFHPRTCLARLTMENLYLPSGHCESNHENEHNSSPLLDFFRPASFFKCSLLHGRGGTSSFGTKARGSEAGAPAPLYPQVALEKYDRKIY